MKLSKILKHLPVYLLLILPVVALAEPVPAAPQLNAKAWILVDAATGYVLLEQNADEKLPPASLTKLMTSYVLSAELESGRVHNEDMVPVSSRAWAQSPEFDAKNNGSSLMFISPDKPVSLLDLHRGIVISSGNDATVAVAEYLAGSEGAFVDMMNQYAQKLGMSNTHYVNTHGLDTPEHYSSARDLSVLARAIIKTKDYPLHKEKEFIYNGIKQQNRNGLLWTDATVDGLKTGHTDGCGYCLVASALRDNTRLVSVVLGAPSIKEREAQTEVLLNYGFRFFQSVKLYAADAVLATPRVWKGTLGTVNIIPASEVSLVVQRNVAANLTNEVQIDSPLLAPITAGQKVGQIVVRNGDQVIYKVDAIAQTEVPRAGFFGVLWDTLSLFFGGLFGMKV
ncbi:MAG TPA: D-alanyl-D-alanine carboxypeptidase family protein [Pseudomonadales bacterium]|nr:D-alanyl-D-alanine carboxypeptidase family protein [Pseudomonadales bacterium]